MNQQKRQLFYYFYHLLNAFHFRCELLQSLFPSMLFSSSIFSLFLSLSHTYTIVGFSRQWFLWSRCRLLEIRIRNLITLILCMVSVSLLTNSNILHDGHSQASFASNTSFIPMLFTHLKPKMSLADMASFEYSMKNRRHLSLKLMCTVITSSLHLTSMRKGSKGKFQLIFDIYSWHN